MRLRSVVFLIGARFSCAPACCAHTAQPSALPLPRTSDGKPDLQGVVAGPQTPRQPDSRITSRATEGRAGAASSRAARSRTSLRPRRSARSLRPIRPRPTRSRSATCRACPDHVSELPLPDSSNPGAHRDHVRMVAGAPHHLHQRRERPEGSISGWAIRADDGRATRSSSR
jgi:hypothetical protein